MIPIDGSVSDGVAEVNEASMTGESLPQHKTDGMTVYAGTVIEEGSLDIVTTKRPDDSRIHNIIDLIENSEDLKSSLQTKAESFADRLVPISFLTSIGVYLFTGNITKGSVSAYGLIIHVPSKLFNPDLRYFGNERGNKL